MIPTAQEVIYRVYGAWQFARLNAGATQYFEESPQAALRSFFAAVLVAPAYLILILLAHNEAPPRDPLEVGVVVLLGYSLLWTVFPLVAYRICLIIDRERAFFRYLCADNWSSIITQHFQLVVLLLIAGGIVPEVLASLVVLAMYACLLIYSWFIARSCLDVSSAVAAGFIVLQQIVGLLIQFIVTGILYPDAS